jgi:hypothetical protein
MNKFKMAGLFIALTFFQVLMVVQSNLALADDTGEVESLVIEFFEYLKTGDTEAIISSLTDPILSNHRRTLRNPNYPYQLMQAYGGAEVVVKKTKIINDYMVQIFVKIRNGDGSVSKTSVLIKKINDRWKIADEIKHKRERASPWLR